MVDAGVSGQDIVVSWFRDELVMWSSTSSLSTSRGLPASDTTAAGNNDKQNVVVASCIPNRSKGWTEASSGLNNDQLSMDCKQHRK